MADQLLTLDDQAQPPSGLPDVPSGPVTVPKSRIGNAANAYSIASQFVNNDRERAAKRTRVAGQIAGLAPYKRSEIPEGTTNLNFLEGKGIVNGFKTPYFDLIVEVPMLADIQTSLGDDMREEWSQIASEEFDRAVWAWRDFDYVMQFSQWQMLVHGIGTLYFPDGIDWRPQCAAIGDVLVADQAPSRVSELDVLVIRKSYTAPAIYKYIRDKESATAVGWKVKEVQQAIVDAKFSTDRPLMGGDQVEWYLSKFVNADLYESTGLKNIQSAMVLNREFDDRVSHHIVRADRTPNEFLYTNVGRFEAMDKIVFPFFFDIGDGTWHSVTGIGRDIFAYCEVFNRLRGREVDGAMISASALFKPKTAEALGKSQLAVIRNLGILPPDTDIETLNIGQGIQAVTAVRQDMAQGLSQNIGAAGRDVTNARDSWHLANAKMQQAASLNKGAVNRYYVSLDAMLTCMVNRMSADLEVYRNLDIKPPGVKEALEFQDRCKKRGVPIEALRNLDSVHAYRSIGAGSAAQRIAAIEWGMANAGSYSEEGRDTMLRIATATMLGNKTMRSIMGAKNKKVAPTSDDWAAAMENTALRGGARPEEVPIVSGQSDVKHLESHMSDMDEHIAEVETQMSQSGMTIELLQPLSVHLDAAGVHCKLHLENIQNDQIRKKDYNVLIKKFMQLSNTANKVHNNLDHMIQAQQGQSQPKIGDSSALDFGRSNYAKLPESVKAEVEQLHGLTRAEGDLSVAQETLKDKQAKLEIQAAKASVDIRGKNQQMVHSNVDLAMQVQDHNSPDPASSEA